MQSRVFVKTILILSALFILSRCSSDDNKDSAIETETPNLFVVVLNTAPSDYGTTTPQVQGYTNPHANVQLYANSSCSQSEGTGGANFEGAFSIGVSLEPGETKTFYARATDKNGHYSSCSSTSVTFTAFPINPQNLLLWVDAFDESTLYQQASCEGALAGHGDSVACWQDKSGHDNHIANASSPPTLSNHGVSFDGSNAPLRNHGIEPDADSTLSVFVVSRIGSQTSSSSSCCRPFVSWVNNSSGLYPWLGVTRSGFNPPNDLLFGWRGGPLNPIEADPGDEVLMSGIHDGDNKTWNTFLFGSQTLFDETIPGSYGTSTVLNVGGDHNHNARRYVGDIKEVIVYDSALSTQERQAIEGYLACKHQKRNLLPTEHPFYHSLPNSPNGCPGQ